MCEFPNLYTVNEFFQCAPGIVCTPVPAAQPANSTFKVSDLEKALKDMREVKSREELEKVWYANKSLTNNKEFLDVTKQMSIIYPKKESV